MFIRFRPFAILIAAVFALALAACGSTPTQSSTGQYIDDTVITTKVKAKLFEDPEIKSGQISVETFKGEVQLSGFVSSKAAIARATEIAARVEGVARVKNSLVLR